MSDQHLHEIDGGTLVDLMQFTRVLFHGLPINWMTLHLFDDFKPFFEDEEGYVKNFGVALGSILRTKLQFAQIPATPKGRR